MKSIKEEYPELVQIMKDELAVVANFSKSNPFSGTFFDPSDETIESIVESVHGELIPPIYRFKLVYRQEILYINAETLTEANSKVGAIYGLNSTPATRLINIREI